MKVAYYSPLPPERTGIADYSALLLPALRERVQVDVAKRGGRARGDVSLYHLGNNPDAHGWILERLRAEPGVVVLHDFVLHHLIAGMTLGRKDGPSYLAALERDGGVAARLLGLGVIDGCIPPLWEVRPEDFPLCDEVLDHARGVIVHSRYVGDRVRDRGYAGRVLHVPHPAWQQPAAPAERGVGEPLFGVFGNLNAAQRVGQLLDGFARHLESHPESRLLVVGAAAPGTDLDLRIEAAGVADAATWLDYVDESRLWSLMAGVDAVVSLRSPTMGETSGTVIRALTLGKPLVVSDVGWFAELPDAVAIKVAPDEREAEAVAEALERLTDPATREAMGAAARALAETEHGLDHVADLYLAALEEAAGGEAVRDAVVGTLTTAAADVGIDAESREAEQLARTLDEVEL
jgi:glycosyltransferase involved in cell wall biosynthesis